MNYFSKEIRIRVIRVMVSGRAREPEKARSGFFHENAASVPTGVCLYIY